MAVYHEASFRIDYRHADLFGHCRPSALLGFLQEAATAAAAEIRGSREELLEKYNVFWAISRLRYTLQRPLLVGEVVTVKTWHRGNKGAVMYREFDLLVDGEVVGQALTAWVLIDATSHKLFRLSNVAELEGTDGGELCREDELRKFRIPDDMPFAETRKMYYSNTDVNGHINNCSYADFVCDTLGLENLLTPQRFVSSFQICYVAECKAGESLSLYSTEKEGCFCVLGLGNGGEERFRAFLTLDKNEKED